MVRAAAVAAIAFALRAGAVWAAMPPAPAVMSDYDSGHVYWVRGEDRQAIHGMQEAWVFNRAMVWLDDDDGVKGAVLCYSNQNPLLLTGRKQVSRWFAGKANELTDIDDAFTRFVKKDATRAVDHAALPSFQFHLWQHPVAELEVREATHPWQLLIAIKGRSGPPLYASPWQEKPGKLAVDLRKLYRDRGYHHHFAQLTFAVAAHTKEPKEEARAVFRLRLDGRAAIIPSLPVIRTEQRAKANGVPIYALVLDTDGKRLGRDSFLVVAGIGKTSVDLAEDGKGIWKGVVKGLPAGEHEAIISAIVKPRPRGGRTAALAIDSTLRIHVTDGRFIGYDPTLKLLTEGGKPIGPFAGSYRGAPMFKGIGTLEESLVQGQEQWAAVQGTVHEGQHCNHGGPLYGFHWWESLTRTELDTDYAYLARCGWSVAHLCQGWWVWERLDAGGRIAPHGAEQLAAVTAAARRHGLHVHFALSHYPLGKQSAPYAQYLEAGYQRGDYGKADSRFYAMFRDYLAHFTTLFRDDTGISGFTAAGEGDPDAGPAFVNFVHDAVSARDPDHLFLCEPHHGVRQHPNYYRTAGWKPLLGGMRTYAIDRRPIEAVAAQFQLAALGHVFMAEGIFWGYMGGPTHTDRYRERVRETLYTGLALRNPIMMTWEERVVEDERVVLEQVRRAVDWSKPFARPRLVIRVSNESLVDAGGRALVRYEQALSRLPLAYTCVWGDDPAPPDARHTIDARQPFEEPRFASDGGKLPDALKADMPLRLPEAFAATYSWSQDRRTLVAFIRDASATSAAGGTTEAGHYTYADTTLALDRDMAIDTWEVHCVRPGRIQLRIYRTQGDQLVFVGSSEMVEMKEPGPCRFRLGKPVDAKKGDMLGLYIPSPDTHVRASHGGRMLFFDGQAPDAESPLGQWQTERKIADIAAFNAADAKAKPKPPAPADGIVLQHFPPGKLAYRLFDLAAKKAVDQGHFEKGTTLAAPSEGRHFFLLVGDHE